jgi:hypothetical protein
MYPRHFFNWFLIITLVLLNQLSIKIYLNWRSTNIYMWISPISNTVSPPQSSLDRLNYIIQLHMPLYWNNSIGQNSNLEKPRRPNLVFLKSQISLAALIQVSTLNEPLGVVPSALVLEELCVPNVEVLDSPLEQWAAKTTITLIVSRCPVQQKLLSFKTAVAPPAVNPS